jgi:hypothetical protein
MSDKRIALQGITAAFEKAPQEKCYFGCWGEDLHEDLHWHRDTPDDSHVFLVRPVALQEQPSWLWLSTSGQVYTSRIVGKDKNDLKWPANRATIAQSALAVLELNAQTGSILVHGPLGRVSAEISSWGLYDISDSSFSAGRLGWMQIDCRAGDLLDIYCCVTTMINDDSSAYKALFLQKVEGSADHYSRVGFGHIDRQEGLSGGLLSSQDASFVSYKMANKDT